MTLKEKIQFLLDNGFSYNQLGKICECHPTSISKWMVDDNYKISNRLQDSINNHIQTFIKNLNDIWM